MEEELADSTAAVTRQVREAFKAAVEQLGTDAARQIWLAAMSSYSPKRGRPPKRELSHTDQWLLRVYDALVDDPNPRSLPRHLGIIFNRLHPRRYHSAVAVERQLRRLLKARREGRL